MDDTGAPGLVILDNDDSPILDAVSIAWRMLQSACLACGANEEISPWAVLMT